MEDLNVKARFLVFSLFFLGITSQIDANLVLCNLAIVNASKGLLEGATLGLRAALLVVFERVIGVADH